MPDSTSAGLAAKLTPAVQRFLGDHKDEFASRAGGPLQRTAVRWGIPIAQRETPVVLGYGLDELATELATWSVADLLRWFASVADRKGLPEGRLMRELRSMAP